MADPQKPVGVKVTSPGDTGINLVTNYDAAGNEQHIGFPGNVTGNISIDQIQNGPNAGRVHIHMEDKGVNGQPGINGKMDYTVSAADAQRVLSIYGPQVNPLVAALGQWPAITPGAAPPPTAQTHPPVHAVQQFINNGVKSPAQDVTDSRVDQDRQQAIIKQIDSIVGPGQTSSVLLIYSTEKDSKGTHQAVYAEARLKDGGTLMVGTHEPDATDSMRRIGVDRYDTYGKMVWAANNLTANGSWQGTDFRGAYQAPLAQNLVNSAQGPATSLGRIMNGGSLTDSNTPAPPQAPVNQAPQRYALGNAIDEAKLGTTFLSQIPGHQPADLARSAVAVDALNRIGQWAQTSHFFADANAPAPVAGSPLTPTQQLGLAALKNGAFQGQLTAAQTTIAQGVGQEYLQGHSEMQTDPSAAPTSVQLPLSTRRSQQPLNTQLNSQQPRTPFDAGTTGNGQQFGAMTAVAIPIDHGDWKGSAAITLVGGTPTGMSQDFSNKTSGEHRQIRSEIDANGAPHVTFVGGRDAAGNVVDLHLDTQGNLIGTQRGVYSRTTHKLEFPPVTEQEKTQYAGVIAAAQQDAQASLDAYKKDPKAATQLNMGQLMMNSPQGVPGIPGPASGPGAGMQAPFQTVTLSYHDATRTRQDTVTMDRSGNPIKIHEVFKDANGDTYDANALIQNGHVSRMIDSHAVINGHSYTFGPNSQQPMALQIQNSVDGNLQQVMHDPRLHANAPAAGGNVPNPEPGQGQAQLPHVQFKGDLAKGTGTTVYELDGWRYQHTFAGNTANGNQFTEHTVNLKTGATIDSTGVMRSGKPTITSMNINEDSPPGSPPGTKGTHVTLHNAQEVAQAAAGHNGDVCQKYANGAPLAVETAILGAAASNPSAKAGDKIGYQQPQSSSRLMLNTI